MNPPTTPIPADTGTERPEKLRDFSRSLPMALLRAREAVMARFRPLLRAHDVTEQQWRVLRALNASPEPLKPSEISRMTFLSLPSLSRLLRTLEARGLMARSAHGADQRAAQLALSAAGRALVEAIAPVSEACYAGIGEAIGEDDVASLYALLDKVAQRLETPNAAFDGAE